jgi:hypothetical protein
MLKRSTCVRSATRTRRPDPLLPRFTDTEEVHLVSLGDKYRRVSSKDCNKKDKNGQQPDPPHKDQKPRHQGKRVRKARATQSYAESDTEEDAEDCEDEDQKPPLPAVPEEEDEDLHLISNDPRGALELVKQLRAELKKKEQTIAQKEMTLMNERKRARDVM